MPVAFGVVMRVALVTVRRNLVGIPGGVSHPGRCDVVEADDRLHGMRNSPDAHCQGQDGRKQKGQSALHTARITHPAPWQKTCMGQIMWC